jgi:RHS repeat-associated protein
MILASPPRPRRRIGAVAAVLAIAACVGGATVGFAASDGAGGAPRALPGLAAVEAKVEAAQQRELARLAQLRSPDARATRQRSRTLFGGLSEQDALALGGQAFPGALDDDVWVGLTDLPGGQRVDRYLGDFAARIERPGKSDALVESTVPLRVGGERGDKAPVDLALEDRGGFLESANPIVPVRFHEDPADGVTLERSGVGIALAGAAPAADGEERADRLAVADALTDTDFWASPTPGGFETFAVLRSPASPERIALDVELPRGAELRQLPGGAAAVFRGGERVATVSAPVANDADGRPVAVDMAAEGSQLSLSVAHRDADVRYPLLVDPEIVEEWDWEGYWDEAPNGWAGYTNHANTFDWTYEDLPNRWNSALYVFTRSGATVNNGDYGGWVFNPQGPASYVYRAEMKASTNALSACMYRGINDGYDTKTNCSAVNYNYTTSCVVSNCDPAAGGNDNWAYFRLQSTTTSVRSDATKAIAGLSYAKVFYSDRDVPSFAGVNSGGTGIAWAQSYSGQVTGNVTDASLGMGSVELQVAGVPIDGGENDCEGVAHDPCPASAGTDFPIDSTWPPLDASEVEGKHAIVLTAEDAVGNQSSATWGNYWIDRSGPSLALSGSLWNGRVVTEPGTSLSASSSHGLHIVATDGVQGGSAAQRRSGLKSVEVRVDGETVLAPDDVSCPPASTDSCPDTRDYTFSTGEFAQGRRTVEVVAKDQAGNQTVQAFDVIVPAAGELLSPEADSATSRWLQFEAHADNPSLTTVKFQYRRPLTGWQDVPQAAMTDSQGQPVTTINHPLTNGNSPVINWDVPVTWALLGAEPGPLDVRARFSDGSGPGGSSKTTKVTFDPRGLGADNAKTAVGPGSVDLATGNLALTATDAALPGAAQSISFSRSFNSRDPQANPNGPFGPGWVTSVPVAGAAEYAAVKEYSDAVNGTFVELTLTNGGKIYFIPKAGGGYQPDTGAESLTLTKPASDRFRLDDTSGNSSLFVHQASTPASQYDLTEVTTPGSNNKGTVTYDAGGRVSRITAPIPTGVSCTSPNNRGCRTLTFNYATATTATGTAEANWGSYSGRLESIEMKAWDDGPTLSDTPAAFLYDNAGKLRAAWDSRGGATRKVRYGYDAGGRVSQITPPGLNALTIAYEQLAGDGDGGRLKSVSRSTPQGTATTTMAYNVAVSGLAAPYQMGMSDVAAWSQDDYAITATAVFPPDQVPASPPTSYSKATLHYLNRAGRLVNAVSPGGSTTTSEYDRYGNVIRELSPANRARALASGGLSVQVSERLDTQRVYQDEGQELVDELGPEHEIKLEGGSVVQARAHTVTAYDEGAPSGKNPHLPTTTTTSAQVVGGPASADARVSKTEYDWTLLKPTKTISDHGGLNLTTQTTYDSTTGLPLTATMPKSGSGVRHTTYYKSTGSGTCGDRAEWDGLVCQSYVTASGGLPSQLPSLPVETFTYNRNFQRLTEKREADGEQLTATSTYTPTGQLASTRTQGSGGSANGLVAAYGFEEPSGTTATDSSASANNGILENGTVRSDAGRFGRALKFDGTNDRVRVPDSSSLDLASMTLEAWVKVDAASSNRTVISRGSTGSGCTGPAYGMRIATTSPSGGWCGSWFTPPAMYKVRERLWSHVAITQGGTTMKIYIDGQQVHSAYQPAGGANDTADMLIGAASSGGQFAGLIDEVRMYNRVLSAGEIADDMRRPVVGGAIHPPATPGSDLRAAYGFEEKPSSNQLLDSSTNGNDGTMSGATYAGEKRLYGGHHGAGIMPIADLVPDSSSLDLTTGATVEAWFGFDTSKPSYGAYPVTIAEKAGSYGLYYAGFGQVYFMVNVGGNDEIVGATISQTMTKAVHLAGTYNGSSLKLYVDGVQAASLSVSGNVTADGAELQIGDATYTGVIDELRVYGRALSATEIQTDAATPIRDGYELPSDGEPLAQTSFTYDSATGLPLTQSSTDDGTTRTITTAYDAIGRATSYTDADGVTSTTTYDFLSRPTALADGKGTKSLSYDATTGQLTSVTDSQAGTFTASYDADGKQLSQTYPNGMIAETGYNEAGSPTTLTYTKTSNCSTNCVWYDEEVQESISGQWLRRDSTLSDQDYAYDGAGRLTLVKDTPAGQGCTTRSYAYDANSNRTSLTTRAPGAGGACDTMSAGQLQSSSYDNADRLTTSGVTYDTWGRARTIPGSHAGGDALHTTYYVNDMVRTQTQGVLSKGWLLDPTRTRYRATVPSGNVQEVMHYSGDSDSPSWSEVKNGSTVVSWERSVGGIDGGLAAVVSNNGSTTTTKLQLSNLHGDVIATADPNPAVTALLSTAETDEFGNPRGGSTTAKYGYLGGKERRTVMPSGVVQMGVRAYVPAMGRFTSVDPVAGGSANDYDYANADPVGGLDLDGRKARRRRPATRCANKAFSMNARVDGDTVATVTQDMTWCWRGGRVTSVTPLRTHGASNGWRAYGKWDTQRAYGPRRQYYRSTVTLSFESCKPSISIGGFGVGETCSYITMTSDVYVKPNYGWSRGPLESVTSS